jgi:hypothetical protein
MISKSTEREEARKLRIDGKSLTDISSILHVAKSSVSGLEIYHNQRNLLENLKENKKKYGNNG